MQRRKFVTALSTFLGIGAIEVKAKSNLRPEDVIKAWEDPAFRKSLTDEQWDSLPKNPAGEVVQGEFSGNLQVASGNFCSGNNCSGNNCSGNNCSGDNCSGNNCSGNNCSGNNCSGDNCSGNNCSSGYYC